ncbi:MAG: DinB family protein [Candidatus Acidiferrales bacterium]
MKRHVLAVAVVVLVGAGLVLQAGSGTATDKEATLKHLEESRAALVAATKGLSAAQWDFREAPERWSAAEIVEHLAASEDLLFNLVTEQVMKTEKMAEPLPNVEESDKQVVAFLTDRSQKFQAPEPLRPTNRFETPEKAMEHFLESRARTIEYLKATPDLRLYALEGPGGAKRDAQQWLLFISGHTVRHTLQMNEVKAHAEFPKE